MSATIGVNNSKFVIFGSGHDYTLADSGLGEKIFFSHPFVPLNSVNYAGQYYLALPVYDEEDETAEPILTDVVKDDIAHCTFTPDLGTAFDTEGEVEVTVHYRREYPYDESTILVEKEMTQTIEVVDHGTIANSYTNLDVYTDGYGFIKPQNTNVIEVKNYTLDSNNMTKISSIPWRATGLGESIYNFVNSEYLTDISELEFADVSKCTLLVNLFSNCKNLEDISALENWDVSNVTRLSQMFTFTKVASLEALANWDVSNVTRLDSVFANMDYLGNLKGLENWDVSSVADLRNMFYHCDILSDISALADWDVSSVTNLNGLFAYCIGLTNLEGLEDWDVSNVTDLQTTFFSTPVTSLLPLSSWNPKPTRLYRTFSSCSALTTLQGLENFDMSDCTDMMDSFLNCRKLVNVDGLESWDVSNVGRFNNCFGYCYWISDISALANWQFGAADLNSMFTFVSALLNVDDVTWDWSQIVSASNTFLTHNYGVLENHGLTVYEEGDSYYDYQGNRYSTLWDNLIPYTKDASNAENWIVNNTGLKTFDDKWSNRPTWN